MMRNMVILTGFVCVTIVVGLISSVARADDGWQLLCELQPEECAAIIEERLLSDGLDDATYMDDRGTCDDPKKTGGCLKCENKASCKVCCQTFSGQEKTGCLRGCNRKKW